MSYRLPLVLLVSWLAIVSLGSTASAAALTVPGPAPGILHTVRDTRRIAAVGALFHGPVSAGDHFCTAGVVAAPGRDLLITAAHCLTGGRTTGVSFVPGYHDGTAPYGVWRLASVTVDPRWTRAHDPDLDVAFATVRPHDGRRLQDVVGGYPVATGRSRSALVRLSGYPAAADAPITCVNRASARTATQLRIACTGYTGGTSGSPWINGGHGVVGVIGGYQYGGATADVSYSPYFGSAVAALYRRACSATSQGGVTP